MDTKRQRMIITARWATLALGVVLALGLPRPVVGQVSFAKTDFPTGTAPQAVAVADLNGDGKLDLVVGNTGGVSVLLGTGSFGAKTDFPMAGASAVAVADVNGDGHLDLVASGGGVSVLLGTGTGSFGAPTGFATGTGPVAVAVADLNGDGHLDVVTANRND